MAVNYAAPRSIASKADCYFYHTIDLPEGEIKGDWDLRGAERAYVGELDLSGKRVLDMGAASGFMTFAMERMGADVVAYDIGNGRDWNVVPHHTLHGKMEAQREAMGRSSERLKNSFWYSHKALGSRTKAFYGDIYSLPNELATFDAILYGLILTHLRDPFQALYSGARLCAGTIIVTGMFGSQPNGASVFRPDYNNTHGLHSWWLLSASTLENMLGALGFKIKHVQNFSVMCVAPRQEGRRDMQAIVAERV